MKTIKKFDIVFNDERSNRVVGIKTFGDKADSEAKILAKLLFKNSCAFFFETLRDELSRLSPSEDLSSWRDR